MVDILQNLQDVYAKWEIRAKPRIPLFSQDGSTSSAPAGKTSRQPKQQRTRQRNRHLRSGFSIPLGTKLSHFKMAPTISPGVSLRPFMGTACYKCFPNNQKSLVDEVTQSLGLKNILLVETQNNENSYFTKKFCYLVHVIQRKVNFNYPVIGSSVLKEERVKSTIEAAVTQDLKEYGLEDKQTTYKTLTKKYENRAARILQTMTAGISVLLLRFTAWVVFRVLSRLLSSLQINKGQLEMLQKASNSGLPLIFLPQHRSHLDYILVTFILYNYEIKVPLIAAGDNLRIPILGSILRGLGAFFIKRRLDSYRGKKDTVYRSILHTYMIQCLRAGHNMEFFIEGTRSRTGKASIPKGGLLSVVVSAYMDGTIEDALLVPIGISYDCLMDGNFIREQLGQPKVMETFLGAVRAVFGVMGSSYGSVRVDFGQPFSLREFVQSYQSFTARLFRCTNSPLRTVTPSINGLGNLASGRTVAKIRSTPSSSSLHGLDIVTEDQRHLVESLAKHIIHDAVHCTSVMSTNVVAFLLLNKFRNGTTLQKLAEAVDWLKHELAEKKRDVGFTGRSVEVVNNAVNLLGPGLVRRERVAVEMQVDNNNVEIIFLKPVTMLPNVIELSYYSNVTISPFVSDAVVATALNCLVEERIQDYSETGADVTLSRNMLIQKSVELCDIFQFEFTFTSPCQPLENAIADSVQTLITKEALQTVEETVAVTDQEKWAQRFSKTLDTEDSFSEDEDYYQDTKLRVVLSKDTVEYLQFLIRILRPFVDTYYFAACTLEKLVQREIQERELLFDIMGEIKTRMDQGLVSCGESLTLDPIKNSLRLFEHWKVLECYCEENIKLFYLNKEYDNEESISDVISRIYQFKK